MLLGVVGATTGGGAFNPASVPGLELWLDGRDLVGADGASISTWTKRAGTSGTDAVQGIALNQPIIKSGANGLNGLPVARFNGTTDIMVATFNPGSTGLTFYIVARTGAALTAYGTVLGSGGGATANGPTTGIDWAFSHGNSGDGFGAGWGGPTENVGLGDPPGIAINTAFQNRYRTNKIAWSIVGNGGSTPADTSFPTGTFNLNIGGLGVKTFDGTIYFPFNGDVAAALAYSAAVSDANDTLIRAYLSSVWGV